MVDVARPRDRDGFKTTVRMLGESGYLATVVHPPAVFEREVASHVPPLKVRGGYPHPHVSGWVVVSVVCAEEERVNRRPV